MHPWWDERVGPVSLMRWITFRPLFVRQKYLIVVIIRKYLDTVIVTTSGQPATPHQLPQTFGLQVIRPIIGDFPINPHHHPFWFLHKIISFTLYTYCLNCFSKFLWRNLKLANDIIYILSGRLHMRIKMSEKLVLWILNIHMFHHKLCNLLRYSVHLFEFYILLSYFWRLSYWAYLRQSYPISYFWAHCPSFAMTIRVSYWRHETKFWLERAILPVSSVYEIVFKIDMVMNSLYFSAWFIVLVRAIYNAYLTVSTVRFSKWWILQDFIILSIAFLCWKNFVKFRVILCFVAELWIFTSNH